MTLGISGDFHTSGLQKCRTKQGPAAILGCGRGKTLWIPGDFHTRWPTEPWGEVLPYIGYTGMCHWKGYGFQAIWSGIGSSKHKPFVQYRVPFYGIAHKRLISRTFEHF